MSAQLQMLDDYPASSIPDVVLWSENYALLAGDPATSGLLFYSIGRCVSDPTVWREVIAVVLPDRRVIFAKNFGRNSTATGPGASLSRLAVVERERELRLTFDGPMWESTNEELLKSGFVDGPTHRVRLDLTFSASEPMWHMKGDSEPAVNVAGSSHIEQIGSVRGVVEYRGTSVRFSGGYANRDHSRGVRDISKYKGHCWANGTFPGHRSFHLYAMQLHDSDKPGLSSAVIFQGRRPYPAQIVHTDLLTDAESPLVPKVIVLGSGLGEMKIEIKRTHCEIWVSMLNPYDMCIGAIRRSCSVVLRDEFVGLEWNEVSGSGWTERGMTSHRL